jgi:hypothetical protein
MILFNKFKKWRETRYIKSTFEQFVPKKVVESILKGEISDIQEMKKIEIDFILIKVDDIILDNIPKKITEICNYLLNQKNVMIDSFFSSLIYVIIVNKNLNDTSSLVNRRKELVSNLLKLFNDSISIIHGRSACIVGNLGNSQYMQYSHVLPNMNILKKLIELPKNKDYEI